VTFDHVLPTGQKVQFGGVEDVGVMRPNRVFVDWQSDLGARQLWYDGASVTITDPSTPFYAAASRPRRLPTASATSRACGFDLVLDHSEPVNE